MLNTNPREVIGGNNPPPYDPEVLAEAQKSVADFNDAAKAWLDLKELETSDQSERLTDFVSGARKVWKKVDDARSTAKKPHDDAGAAVQSAFKPLLDTITKMVDLVKPMQAAWLRKVQKAEEERIAALRREEEAARKAAADAAKAAEAQNDVAAQVNAERLQKEADALAKAAARPAEVKASSATGAGRSMSMRQVREVEIINSLKVFMRYRDNPEVLEALKRVATAEVRKAGWPKDGTIDGTKITVREYAV